ncbi:MAG: DUF58 domain-containing protein [Parvibaculaceae bacterium]
MDPLDGAGIAPDAEALIRLRHVVRNIPERRLAPTGTPGGFVSPRRGRGVEAVDIRVYAEGDDIRHIDRNVTARTGITHVRTFHDERERAATLVGDFRPSMLWGTRRAFRSVAAAEALAIVGWRVVEAGGRVGLVAFSVGQPTLVPARPRAGGMAAVIGGVVSAHRSALESASVDRADATPIEDAVELARRVTPTGGSVFLATGLDDAGSDFDLIVTALRRRCYLTVLLVVDAFEHDPRPGNYPFVARSGRIARANLDRIQLGRVPDERRARLEKLGVPFVVIETDLGPEGMAEKLEISDGRLR